MEFDTVFLSRKELRRFLEIANGDKKAKNTPEEDALFRTKLIEERLLAFCDLSDATTSADERGIVLSDLGKEYYAQYMNERRKKRREDMHRRIGYAIAIAGILIPILFAIYSNS